LNNNKALNKDMILQYSHVASVILALKYFWSSNYFCYSL